MLCKGKLDNIRAVIKGTKGFGQKNLKEIKRVILDTTTEAGSDVLSRFSSMQNSMIQQVPVTPQVCV